LVLQVLTAQLAIVISFGLGALLIALFALLKRDNHPYAWFSLIAGIVVWLLLLWFTLGNPVIRYQILHYGLQGL
jgi:hypothetical protein